MKPILILVAVAATLAACTAQPETPSLAVVEATDALCRPTPNGRDVTACYITLTASQAHRLISVSTPLAQTAEVHEMKTEGGIMQMGALTGGLPLPAGEAVSLAPGGNHIMLTGVKTPLAAGDTVALTLTFEKAAVVEIEATVGQPTPSPRPDQHSAH